MNRVLFPEQFKDLIAELKDFELDIGPDLVKMFQSDLLDHDADHSFHRYL